MVYGVYKAYTELELNVHDSWITNQFLDPTKQEFVKLYQKLLCPKYDKFEIIAQTASVCLSVWSQTRLNNERKNYVECFDLF